MCILNMVQFIVKEFFNSYISSEDRGLIVIKVKDLKPVTEIWGKGPK